MYQRLTPFALALGLLLVSGAPTRGQMSWGHRIQFTAPRRAARVINFPPKFSVGLLKMVPCPGVKGREIDVAGHGSVAVPAGYMTLLVAEHRLFAYPELIDTFAPDDFDSIQLTAVAFDDKEEGEVDKVLAKIGHLKGLREVVLDRSEVSDAALQHVCELPELQRLSVFAASFSGTCLKGLSALPHLASLRLSQNYLNQAELRYLSNMHSLRSLALSRCNLKNAALRDVGKCTLLTALDLSGNPDLSDEGLNNLAALKNLRYISMGQTKCTIKGLLQLQGLPLNYIQLAEGQLSSADLAALRRAFPSLNIFQKLHSRPVNDEVQTIFAPTHK
ncbi:MAG: hypothetical protein JST01_09335 [Cyanobacteria bacterium SZAS TMP-1]|nr:hypothetical protein [Cyanobacteria bacterium SZAS TMP-1]